MSSDHDTEELPRTDSLFHKAANFAIYALVGAFVLQFLYTKVAGKFSESVSALLGFVPTVVTISAIPAGFIALCAIPRYGIKKLLWKGLVGVIGPIALFVVSVYAFALARETVRQNPEWVKQDESQDTKP